MLAPGEELHPQLVPACQHGPWTSSSITGVPTAAHLLLKHLIELQEL